MSPYPPATPVGVTGPKTGRGLIYNTHEAHTVWPVSGLSPSHTRLGRRPGGSLRQDSHQDSPAILKKLAGHATRPMQYRPEAIPGTAQGSTGFRAPRSAGSRCSSSSSDKQCTGCRNPCRAHSLSPAQEDGCATPGWPSPSRSRESGDLREGGGGAPMLHYFLPHSWPLGITWKCFQPLAAEGKTQESHRKQRSWQQCPVLGAAPVCRGLMSPVPAHRQHGSVPALLCLPAPHNSFPPLLHESTTLSVSGDRLTSTPRGSCFCWSSQFISSASSDLAKSKNLLPSPTSQTFSYDFLNILHLSTKSLRSETVCTIANQ